MSKVVQARLNNELENLIESLQNKLGWSESRIVREGIKVLSVTAIARQGKRVIGVGKFSSGKSDLGSNKSHLKGFGRETGSD